jgi:hypothetical protein
MKRREFVAGLGGVATWPLAARAPIFESPASRQHHERDTQDIAQRRALGARLHSIPEAN